MYIVLCLWDKTLPSLLPARSCPLSGSIRLPAFSAAWAGK